MVSKEIQKRIFWKSWIDWWIWKCPQNARKRTQRLH